MSSDGSSAPMAFEDWLKGLTPGRLVGATLVTLGAVTFAGGMCAAVVLGRAAVSGLLWRWLVAPTAGWTPPFIAWVGVVLMLHAVFAPRVDDARGTARIIADEATKLGLTLGLGLLARGLLG